MLIKYFYDDKLAQASYLVGCPRSGSAIVIDPSRDIVPYIQTADMNGLSIDYIAETHIHADYVSGTRELAYATGAQMLLSGEGGTDWQYDFPDDDNIHLLSDGDSFSVGNIRFDVLHTPGHTPEHLCFIITDTSSADAPIGIFTGDFLFVGDIGRPDLLEEAAGMANTRITGAKQQYANIQRFKEMPDYLQIWPGHGAGSACGKSLGAVPSTTLGYEKRFNPAFSKENEDDFVNWLSEGQPEVPPYFAHMKQVNRVGPELMRELAQAQHITEKPDADIVPPDALFIDTRPSWDFARRHIPGTINIPISAADFPTYVGWYVDYEKPTFFIAYKNDVMNVIKALFSIGVDDVPGYFTAEVVEGEAGVVVQKTPREIYDAGLKILDVRSRSEWESEHIPDALHIHMGKLLQHVTELPQDERIAVHCGSGLRSQMVISLLQAQGYQNVINMAGGLDAWKAADLPLEQA